MFELFVIWIFDGENMYLSVWQSAQLKVELSYVSTVADSVKQVIGFGVKSDSYLWLDWSWWNTWGTACQNVSVERSWEYGQQSRSLRQSTGYSVVNLNVRKKLNTETKRFSLACPTLFPLSISGLSVFTSFPSSLSSVVPCLVILTWTMAPLFLPCVKERLENAFVVPN